ncbi:MAG: AI-2E family transporter, partial [Buchnera aphidicola]|nr:AI-2E family transporter [Buchnera aphidicola]
ILTALVQAFLSGIGIIIAGVPYAKLLTMCIVFSCLVQIGSLPILIPSILWLYWTHHTISGTVLLIWSGTICILDNILRPYLIRMGSNLPILLILFGVIGGLLSFGTIGLFI